MTDIRTIWNPALLAGDWLIEGPALATGADLETSVLISLFSDARALPDDVLPGLADDRRGWWAGQLGSRLWLLVREKATEDVRLRAEDYARAALDWMLEDQVADQVEVIAAWAPLPVLPGFLELEVGIYRDSQVIFNRRFGRLWDQERNRAVR